MTLTVNRNQNQQLEAYPHERIRNCRIHGQGPGSCREKYEPKAAQTAKEHGGEVLANSNWEILHGDASLTSGALMRFPDHEAAIKWYNSPEYQQLIDIRSVAMDARFSLLSGLPTPIEDKRESE